MLLMHDFLETILFRDETGEIFKKNVFESTGSFCFEEDSKAIDPFIPFLSEVSGLQFRAVWAQPVRFN